MIGEPLRVQRYSYVMVGVPVHVPTLAVITVPVICVPLGLIVGATVLTGAVPTVMLLDVVGAMGLYRSSLFVPEHVHWV